MLCHPASQGCRVWVNQRTAFAQAGYRVIGYSGHGHGRSEFGPVGRPGTTVDDLRNWIQALSIDGAQMLGAAAGGITALGFATIYPDRVDRLVLVGTILTPNEEQWRAMHARLGIAKVRHAASTEFLKLGPPYRASHYEGVEPFTNLSRQAIDSKGDFTQPTRAVAYWKTLQEVRAPVLLLTAEADLYPPPPMQELIANHLQDHRLVTLPQLVMRLIWKFPISSTTPS
ncbi:alpha/beta hydrolase [Alphaproteobacteria bacterium]|nr:alpha/beta hydrolase [Alphaproteobacteria bacterium]